MSPDRAALMHERLTRATAAVRVPDADAGWAVLLERIDGPGATVIQLRRPARPRATLLGVAAALLIAGGAWAATHGASMEGAAPVGAPGGGGPPVTARGPAHTDGPTRAAGLAAVGEKQLQDHHDETGGSQGGSEGSGQQDGSGSGDRSPKGNHGDAHENDNGDGHGNGDGQGNGQDEHDGDQGSKADR
jgi:hypothetical protein